MPTKRSGRGLALILACVAASFCVALLPATALAAAGTVYYVSSAQGDDSNSGTFASPWKSIQKAADTAKAGDTVLVRGGTYHEKVVLKASGKANAFITFQNYPGETPVLDGAGQPSPVDDWVSGLIMISNKSYIKVIGFEVTDYEADNNSVPTGIGIMGACKHIEIRNCKVHDIKTTYTKSTQNRNAHGIAAYGTNGRSSLDWLVIDQCEVFDCVLGESESVALNGNVTHFAVTNNKIHDNDNIGIDFIGYEGTASSHDYARYGVCSGNEVWNISSAANKTYSDACADAIYVDGGAHITIEKNKVWASDIGIEAASEHRNRASDNVLIRNNLVYDCTLFGISIGGSSDSNGKSTHIRVINNTVYNCVVDMNFQQHCQTRSNVVINNIFYGGDSYWGTRRKIIFSHNITVNPVFVAAGSNFHLQADSPAINAGANNSGAGASDVDGNQRIMGKKIDCGCYECR